MAPSEIAEISVDIGGVGDEANQAESATTRARNTCPRCDSHYREEEMVANLHLSASQSLSA